jgi:hypothetical protein
LMKSVWFLFFNPSAQPWKEICCIDNSSSSR